jgi:hypothetical protein
VVEKYLHWLKMIKYMEIGQKRWQLIEIGQNRCKLVKIEEFG